MYDALFATISINIELQAKFNQRSMAFHVISPIVWGFKS
jgi:hypothetical protein